MGPNRRFPNIAIYTVLFLGTFLLLGCNPVNTLQSTKIKNPEVKYVNYQLGDANLKRITARLNFSAHNPNDIGLKNLFMNYELYIKDKHFLTGKDIELALIANADSNIAIPIEIAYADVLNVLGAAAEHIWTGKNLPVTAKVHIHGKPSVSNRIIDEYLITPIDVVTTQSIDIPIPHNVTQQLLDTLLKH